MAVDDGISGASPAVGLVLAVLALLSWVVYGIWNAEYLSAHPRTDLVVWASLTGLGTLITLPLLLAVEVALSGPPPLTLPPVPLVAWGLILGLGAAWLPTWLWGIASARIAASTLGMLLVGEALFALLYACIVEGRLPRAAEAIAAVLTVGGVLWGLRAARAARRPGPVPPSETGQAAPAR